MDRKYLFMKKKTLFLACLLTFLVLPLLGQKKEVSTQSSNQNAAKKSFGLFEEENPIEISLLFDFKPYFRTKPKKDYLQAQITIHLSKTDSITRDIRLRTRGEFRNTYCGFAPITLNFKNVDFGYSDLNKISKLKLVTQCNSGKEYENYLLREYLIYKLFNVMTDTSFRVRLLTVNYIDSQNKRKPVTQYGFFIEPVEILAARTNSVELESRALNQKSIIPEVMDRLAIFNYMIGNYDWAVPNQHNIKVLVPLVFDINRLAIAVPYDFDWTGLVNASYAIPAEIVGTSSVRIRIFTGVCRSKEVYMKDLEVFLEKKEAFYRVINEFPYLSQNSKKDMINYLDEFFDMLVGRQVIINNLLNGCKKF
jgi:hypothetical protein